MMLVWSALSANGKKLSGLTWHTVVFKLIYWKRYWELDSRPTSCERCLPSCQCEADTTCPCRQTELPRSLRSGWGTHTLHHTLHLHTDWQQWGYCRLLLVSPGPCPEITAPQKHHQPAVVKKVLSRSSLTSTQSPWVFGSVWLFSWFKSISCFNLPRESWRTIEDILAGPHNFTTSKPVWGSRCFRIGVTVSWLVGMLGWGAG